MSLAWMRHCDFYPDIPDSDVDYVALDGDLIIGPRAAIPVRPGEWRLVSGP
jgi:hypothetical protein